MQVLKKIPFPKIDMNLQNEIVKKIDEELNIIKLNKDLVKTYNSKIQETLNKVWSN